MTNRITNNKNHNVLFKTKVHVLSGCVFEMQIKKIIAEEKAPIKETSKCKIKLGFLMKTDIINSDNMIKLKAWKTPSKNDTANIFLFITAPLHPIGNIQN